MSTAVQIWKEQVKAAHLYPDGLNLGVKRSELEEEEEEATPAANRRQSLVGGILKAATKGRNVRSRSPSKPHGATFSDLHLSQ